MRRNDLLQQIANERLEEEEDSPLAQYAAPLGTIAGAALGSLIAPGLGTKVGGALGGMLGSQVSKRTPADQNATLLAKLAQRKLEDLDDVTP